MSLFLFYIEYWKLSRGVPFFMRVNFLGEILSGLSVLFPSSWGYASYSYKLIHNILEIYCSVLLTTVALILLLMRFFRLSYILHYLIIQKQNFLSLRLLNLILIWTAFFGSFLIFVVSFIFNMFNCINIVFLWRANSSKLFIISTLI